MDWPVVLALVLVVPLILFPAVLIWFINVKGIKDIAAQRRLAMVKVFKKRARMGVAVIIPVAIYGVAVWFFFGRFGWQVGLATALVLPVVLFVPFLVWASVASGMSQVFVDRMRRRAARRRAAPVTENVQ